MSKILQYVTKNFNAVGNPFKEKLFVGHHNGRDRLYPVVTGENFVMI